MHDTLRTVEQSREGARVTWIGAGVNLILVILKVAGGVWGRSEALLADAAHSLSDLFTDAVVLVGLRLGQRAPDAAHPWGHGRMETVAAAIVGLCLVGAAAAIAWDAVHTILIGGEEAPSAWAVLVAALSIASKEALYRYTVFVGRRINSSAVVANAWHHRSDALSSVAVLVGVGVAVIDPRWRVLDAWAALLVSVMVCWVGVKVFRDSLREVVDGAPSRDVVDRIGACAAGVAGVESIHDLRVRTSGSRYVVQVHIVVDAQMSVSESHRIAKEVEHCLEAEVSGLASALVHVDPADEEHTSR